MVISLGTEHAKSGDEERTRILVTPVLFHFASLLLIALTILAPVSNVIRVGVLGAIGCAGLAYVANLALLAKKRIKASLAHDIGAAASVVLLVMVLRNSWRSRSPSSAARL